jgi:predicted ATPase/DNA-binding XRE family transcriptional regulator
MPDSNLESFGALLKKYRVAAGLTQEELAELAGLSTRGISDLERGIRRTPYKGTLELLAEALQLSAEERQIFKKVTNRKNKLEEGNRTASGLLSPLASQLPLLGRAWELNRLLNHLSREQPPILLLAGEPGIGKTRLLSEIMAHASKEGWTVLEGSCTRRGGQSLYAPLLEALAGRLSHQTLFQRQNELKDCEWLIRLLPEFRQSIKSPLLEWQQFTPEQERRLVFAAVGRYLANIAGPAGTLLVLDDLQWAAGDALDLIVNLVRSYQTFPLRVIGAYRTTEVSPGSLLAGFIGDLAPQELLGQLELGPLENQPATEMIRLLMGDNSSPPRTDYINQLLERTGGIPFFLVSCIRGLQNGTPDNSAGGGLPWDIKQTIRQRMAALPDVAQELLGIAAVIGRIVKGELLVAVASANWSQKTIIEALEAACRARLLLEFHNSGEVSYRFAHDLIREVVEADLSVMRFQFLHTEVAIALENMFGVSSAQLLVYHYRQAGNWKTALHYLLQAVEQARQVAAHREETDLLLEAIDYATRTGQDKLCLELRVQRGKVCEDLAIWAEADRELTTALAGLKEIPLETQAELLVTLAEVRHWQLDSVATRNFAAQAVAIAEEIGRNDLLGRALSALATGESSAGNLQASQANFQMALKRAGSEHLPQLASGLEVNGLIHYWTSHYDQAITILHQALDMSRQTYNTTIIARALANLGLALSGKGLYVEAFRVFEEARQFAEKNGMPPWKARATAMYGGVYLDLFNYSRAEELSQEARKMSQEIRWPIAETSAGIDLLFNYIRSGRPEQAEAIIEEVAKAVEAGQGAHGWLWRLRFAAAESELLLTKGDLEKALGKAEQVISQSHSLGRVKYEVACLQIRGKVLASTKRQAEAKTDFERALALARSTGNPAMFIQAGATYLNYFKDENFLLEAQSLAVATAKSLENEEISRNFLASKEIQGILIGA